MKLTQLPDNFTTEDWLTLFINMCQDKGLIRKAFPSTNFISRSLHKFAEDYYDGFLIAEVLSSMLDSDYRKSVGISPRLLTGGVFDREVWSYPEEYPWKYYFFEKCCTTPGEHTYFRHWIGVYMDAKLAPSHATPMIENTEFPSWEAVNKMAIEKLEKGVNNLIQRYVDQGSYIYVTA